MIGHSQAHDNSNCSSVVTLYVLTSSILILIYIGKACILIRSLKNHKIDTTQPGRGKGGKGWGVFTLTLYTYKYLPFGVPFHKIWHSDLWVSSEIKEPIYINFVYFEQIVVNRGNLSRTGCFFF